MFSCEFYKFSKDTFFTEHLWATASAYYHISPSYHRYCQTDVIKTILGRDILTILKTFITVRLLKTIEACLLLQFSTIRIHSLFKTVLDFIATDLLWLSLLVLTPPILRLGWRICIFGLSKMKTQNCSLNCVSVDFNGVTDKRQNLTLAWNGLINKDIIEILQIGLEMPNE